MRHPHVTTANGCGKKCTYTYNHVTTSLVQTAHVITAHTLYMYMSPTLYVDAKLHYNLHVIANAQIPYNVQYNYVNLHARDQRNETAFNGQPFQRPEACTA